MKKDNISYFDEKRTQIKKNGCWYNDTGASFYQDIVKHKWKIKNININEYVIHYHHGSQNNKNSKTYLQFLEENINLL